jgi:hypothetical protein
LEPTLLNCLGLQALPEYRQAQQALAALAA